MSEIDEIRAKNQITEIQCTWDAHNWNDRINVLKWCFQSPCFIFLCMQICAKKTTHRNVELVRVVNDSEMSRLFDERVLSVQWVTQLCNIFPKYHQVYVCNGWFCLKALEQMSLCWCCRWLTRIDQFENDRHNQLKCAKFNYFWWCCCCCYLYGVFFLST